MLTSSLITQGLAMETSVDGVQKYNVAASKANLSPAVRNLKTKLTHRTKAYNAKPDDLSIPGLTREINTIYQSALSDWHANDDEREALIKGLMFTAGIHGRAMPLDVSSQIPIGSTLNALQKHYAIINAVDVLSREYFLDDMFSLKEDQYVVLQNYAGLGKEKIDGWLGYTKSQLTGLKKENGKHWWMDCDCKKAIFQADHTQEIIQMLWSQVNAADRMQEFTTQVQKIISGINLDDLTSVINVLLKVDDADRAAYINFVNQFNLSRRSLKLSINYLTDVNPADRATFINHVNQIVSRKVPEEVRFSVICVLLQIRNEYRTQKFIDQASRLITTISERPAIIMESQFKLFDRERIEIREAFKIYSKAVKEDLNKNFTDQLRQLITTDPDLAVDVSIFPLQIDLVDRATFITYVSQLITRNMSVDERIEVMSYISRVNWCARASKLARALLFMRNGNHGVFRQVIEKPLDQKLTLGNMAAVAQGANPYAAGIDVHAEKRDEAAIAAARTLQENWFPGPEDIDLAFNDFMSAVRQLEEPKKSLVLRSLGINQNGHVLPKPANESFAGLLHGVDGDGNFTLSAKGNRMQVSGRELIARFWDFANTYQESHTASGALVENERAAMRDGIMNALAEGVIRKHNTLRCEMGRVQLLALATLQGRLRGSDGKVVDVDGLGLNPEIAVAGAGAAAVAPIAPHVAPKIRNLNDIAQYLQPFIDSLGHDIKTAEQFYMLLFNYRNNLAEGHVMARGERIDLDPSEVVYFVRMMEPITEHGKIVRYDINPAWSIVAQIGFGGAFPVDDYMAQFGARDQAQLTEARRIEAERALREQQDREFKEGVAADRMKAEQGAKEQAQIIKQPISGGVMFAAPVASTLTHAEKRARARVAAENRRMEKPFNPQFDGYGKESGS